MELESTIIGLIRVRDIYVKYHEYEPHPARDCLLEFRDGKYLFDGIDATNIEIIQHIFWIENYGHAMFGIKFLKDIIEDHEKKQPFRRLGGSYTSCGQRLDLNFIPWDIMKDEYYAQKLKEKEAKEEEERREVLDKEYRKKMDTVFSILGKRLEDLSSN